MQTLERLKTRIDRTRDLRSVVSTMKALAAVSIRQYDQAATALDEYRRTIELGFRILLGQSPQGGVAPRASPSEHAAAVVIGSDQGMCGQFNDGIVEWAVRTMAETGGPDRPWRIIAVGGRAEGRLQDAGMAPEETFAVPLAMDGITPLVQDLLFRVEAWRSTAGVDRVLLFHNERSGPASVRPQTINLLPLDRQWFDELLAEPWPTNMLPSYTMDWDTLFSALVQQYLFVFLYRAMVQSLAGENASRLAAMQAAEQNIEEMVEELTRAFNQSRQNAITEELQDIMAGFVALAD